VYVEANVYVMRKKEGRNQRESNGEMYIISD